MRVPVALLSQPPPSGELTHSQALQSPCLTCADTPCCTYLPVHRFEVDHLVDLDYARYLLNFSGIVLGIDGAGGWGVYFHQNCRHLSTDDGSCGLHGRPEQPIVCQNYSPYRCWYKRVMTVPASDEFVRVDRRRLDWYVDGVRYDANRRVTAKPDWETLVATFAQMPLEIATSPAPADDGWTPLPLPARRPPQIGVAAAPRPYADVTGASPCSSCASYCCTRVEFPLDVPHSVASLDFVRFSLGFPGVEIGINADGWRLVVNTTCRNLDGTTCTVYGTDERPIRCSYYDEWRCSYKHSYDDTSARALVRLNADEYPVLLDLVEIDESGQVVDMPSAETIRAYVGARRNADRAASSTVTDVRVGP